MEVATRTEESIPWAVSGLPRAAARLISRSGDGPAYGGTPSDASVISAIRDLRQRGLKVVLYPFVLMDVPAANTLDDPYGAARQPPYPWRGRITCNPAPGRPGSPDRSAAIGTVVSRFAGSAKPSDFVIEGETLRYTGVPGGFRHMILAQAFLARMAGGVDAFLLSSEFRGLTTLRDDSGRFPFVDELIRLAGEVRAILGPGTRLTYGADWSEYFGHQPADGSGDVFFHLDPLWASADIDAVGIDNYLPLSDFRDEDLAAAHPDGFAHAEDPEALQAGIGSGERFDWYYASEADRAARRRTPIADGSAGKPWVFAPKNLAGWWSNLHYERRAGRELASPTAWRPRLKPIWFTELGAPAIDRGANEPNLFQDPKSSESRLPGFSRGHRADSAQRRFLEAQYRYWTAAAAPAGMVSPRDIFLWCWDTRPYPAFPFGTAWTDGDNWRTGHWLNGRLGAGTLATVIAAILADHGFTEVDVSGVSGDLPGYVQADIVPARALIEPLIEAFQLDVLEREGRLVFRSRAEASLPATVIDTLAEAKGEPLVAELRAEAGAIPLEVHLSFADQALDYEPARARAAALSGQGAGAATLSLPAVLDAGLAERLAAGLLRDRSAGRRAIRFRLPPTALALETGDAVTLADGPSGRFLVSRIEEGPARLVEAHSFAPAPGAVRTLAPVKPRPGRLPPGAAFSPEIVFLDLPRMGAGETGSFLKAAATVTPWRPMTLSLSTTGTGFKTRTTISRPAMIGRLAAVLAPGPLRGRFDPVRRLLVDFPFGAPASASRAEVLAGTNRLAVLGADGALEVIGFLSAREVSGGRFELTGLLNGLYGTDDQAALGAPAGSRVVLLNSALTSLALSEGEIGKALSVRLGAGGALGGTAGPFVARGGLRAERPLSPVHLRGRRLANGDLHFTWIRRGRLDADGWEASDIPLDEAALRFRIDLAGTDGRLRRTLIATETRVLYAAETETQDFGARQTALDVTVRQLGRRVPDGVPARARIAL